MSQINKKKQKNGGIFSAITSLFNGGSAAGGVSGAAVSGGIFASKAGVLGLLLGGATIAAGAGAVYHFASVGSNKAYSPELFQKSYYEEEAALARAEREQNSGRNAEIQSTMGMFSSQAKKSGLGFGSAEGQEKENYSEEAPNVSSSEAEVAGSAGAASVKKQAASKDSAPVARLTASSSMPYISGGSSSSGSGVPSAGGIANLKSKFASIKAAGLANGGKATAMASARKSSISKGRSAHARGTSKRAKAQAQFASAMSSKGAYGASAANARTMAENAFSGETTGEGEVMDSVPDGVGLGGAGLSMGNALKANNPSSINNTKHVPQPNEAKDVSPWKATEDAIFVLMTLGAGLLLAGGLLANLAKKSANLIVRANLQVAVAVIGGAVAAIGAAIAVLAVIMATKYKQSSTALMYGIAGAYLAYKGVRLLMDGIKDSKEARPQNQKKYKEEYKACKDQLKSGEYNKEQFNKNISDLNEKYAPPKNTMPVKQTTPEQIGEAAANTARGLSQANPSGAGNAGNGDTAAGNSAAGTNENVEPPTSNNDDYKPHVAEK